MFDDLDDLLDDIPVNKSNKGPSKTSGTFGASSNIPKTALSKVQSTKPGNDDDFDWEKPAPSLGLGQKKIQSAI